MMHDANDKYTFKLEIGEYTLAETTPPAGFFKLTEDIIVTASAQAVTAMSASGGTNYTVNGSGTEDDPYVVIITNTDGKELPNTGGSGNYLNYLGGAALLLTAAVMYGFRMRRRERRYN